MSADTELALYFGRGQCAESSYLKTLLEHDLKRVVQQLRRHMETRLKVTGINPWPLSKMEVDSTIYNSKISNFWTTKSCFEIIDDLLVSVFDKVSEPKLSRFTAQYSSCNLQMPFFRKEQVIYF